MVDHASTDAEAAGPGAEVSPLAQGGDRSADQVGDLGDREQLVVLVRSHGVLLLLPWLAAIRLQQARRRPLYCYLILSAPRAQRKGSP